MTSGFSIGSMLRDPRWKAFGGAMGLTLLLLCCCTALYSLCVNRQASFEDKLVELEALKDRKRFLVMSNKKKSDRVDYLKTDAGVEEIAREKLGLVRAGELAYTIIPHPPDNFLDSDDSEFVSFERASEIANDHEDSGKIIALLSYFFGHDVLVKNQSEQDVAVEEL